MELLTAILDKDRYPSQRARKILSSIDPYSFWAAFFVISPASREGSRVRLNWEDRYPPGDFHTKLLLIKASDSKNDPAFARCARNFPGEPRKAVLYPLHE